MKMKYAINEQIYFDMAVETIRFQRLSQFRGLKKYDREPTDSYRHDASQYRDDAQYSHIQAMLSHIQAMLERKAVKRKIANCLLGFTSCLVTAPLDIFYLPFFMAWFMYNKTEG